MNKELDVQNSHMAEPTKTLDDYLLDQGNQNLLTHIERIGLNPLPFFNLLYELIDLVKNGQPSLVLQRLDGIDVFKAGGLRLFMLHCIREELRSSLVETLGTFPKTAEDQKVHAALFIIDKEYDEVSKHFPPDLFPNDPENSISDRARGEVAASDLTNQVIAGMLKKLLKESEEKAKLEAEITLRVRQEERERLQAEISSMTQEILKSVRQPRHNPEFTTNRQVIALGFMLRRLGVRNIDKQTQADFIEFLTGRNNKEIYDRVRELDQTIYNKQGNDAEYVKEWFRKLKWADLVSEIEELLNQETENL